MGEVVERREEGVEARGEACELEQVFLDVHEPAAGVGEGEEQAAGGDICYKGTMSAHLFSVKNNDSLSVRFATSLSVFSWG